MRVSRRWRGRAMFGWQGSTWQAVLAISNTAVLACLKDSHHTPAKQAVKWIRLTHADDRPVDKFTSKRSGIWLATPITMATKLPKEQLVNSISGSTVCRLKKLFRSLSTSISLGRWRCASNAVPPRSRTIHQSHNFFRQARDVRTARLVRACWNLRPLSPTGDKQSWSPSCVMLCHLCVRARRCTKVACCRRSTL